MLLLFQILIFLNLLQNKKTCEELSVCLVENRIEYVK
jgi:hypothetical protein